MMSDLKFYIAKIQERFGVFSFVLNVFLGGRLRNTLHRDNPYRMFFRIERPGPNTRKGGDPRVCEAAEGRGS